MNLNRYECITIDNCSPAKGGRHESRNELKHGFIWAKNSTPTGRLSRTFIEIFFRENLPIQEEE
jgi:hypothetical protein